MVHHQCQTLWQLLLIWNCQQHCLRSLSLQHQLWPLQPLFKHNVIMLGTAMFFTASCFLWTISIWSLCLFHHSRRWRHCVSRCPSVNTYFTWCDLSLLSDGISVKLDTNIYRVSGNCWKGFQGQMCTVCKCYNGGGEHFDCAALRLTCSRKLLHLTNWQIEVTEQLIVYNTTQYDCMCWQSRTSTAIEHRWTVNTLAHLWQLAQSTWLLIGTAWINVRYITLNCHKLNVI